MSESSGMPREFDTEPPGLEEIAADLHDDEGVDDRRVVLATEGDALVVGGSVATQEEADRALLIAERSGAEVIDRLQIDPALRRQRNRHRSARANRPHPPGAPRCRRAAAAPS